MKQYLFNKGRFLLSAASKKGYPNLGRHQMPEIAIVGRSNVGKSSLLNHLLREKGLAKISTVPGKTQLLNFFMVDEALILVDLPGYGFAKVSKKERSKWGESIEEYLSQPSAPSLILQLLDVRHPPSKQDLEFIKWAQYYQKPLLFIYTKIDKINRSSRHSHIQKFTKTLSSVLDQPEIAGVPYSIKEGQWRGALVKAINHFFEENTNGITEERVVHMS